MKVEKYTGKRYDAEQLQARQAARKRVRGASADIATANGWAKASNRTKGNET